MPDDKILIAASLVPSAAPITEPVPEPSSSPSSGGPAQTIHPSFGAGDSTFIYRPPWAPQLHIQSAHPLPTEITVLIPPPAIQGLFAHRQWRAGLILADAVARGTLDVRGKRVLELGAGTALPGITAALAGARSTVVTDYDASDLVRRLRENVSENIPDVLRAERGRVVVMGHTWGTDVEDLLYDASARADRAFDAILCADLFWDAFSHEVLLKTLGAVLAPGGRVHIAAGSHTGRNVLSRFFRLAQAAGFRLGGVDGEDEIYEWAVVGDEGANGDGVRADLSGKRRPFEEWKVEDVKERNGWMVQCTLTRVGATV
jgi:nicotinamide N-methyltransferase